MWNVDMVIREHGQGAVDVDNVEAGYITIASHTKVTNCGTRTMRTTEGPSGFFH